jgi:hypothetical protein
MVVRVTRLIEYEYPTVEAALHEMERWGVPPNGSKSFGSKAPLIRSAVIGPVFGETAEQIADMTAVPGNLDEDGQREDPSIERAEEMRQELAGRLGIDPISADAVWEEMLWHLGPADEPVPVLKAVHEDLVRRARDLVDALDQSAEGTANDQHVILYRDRLRHWLQQYKEGAPTGDDQTEWTLVRVATEWTAMGPGERATVRRVSNDLYDALGALATWVSTRGR